MNISAAELGPRIESALFALDATRADVEKLCAEAREKKYRAVCVNGSRVELASVVLEDSNVQVVALVGFPLGASDSDVKRYETETAIDFGAQEIDFVINLGKLKDGDTKYVLREMRDIVESADELPVKAAFDPQFLAREEKILIAKLALDSGVQFVHARAGATPEDVVLLRETVGPEFGIIAFAGQRGTQAALELLNAGANRVSAVAGSLQGLT